MKMKLRKNIDRIFLSSTDYDQQDFRNTLMDLLQEYGFNVHTFKTAENSLKRIHSEDECLTMIDSMDCVVGIIGPRPGNPYIGKKAASFFKQLGCPPNLSITHAEIIYAIEKRKIPTIVLVRQGVWDRRNAGDQKMVQVTEFLDYLTRKPHSNFVHMNVGDAKSGFKIITENATLIPRKRLHLLGTAMEGDEWNGKYFFDSKEITVQNKDDDGYQALKELLVRSENDLSERDVRLDWLIRLLSDNSMNPLDLDFLKGYILRYADYSPRRGTRKEQAIDDIKAVNLLERMHFGNNKIFGGYKHSIQGSVPVPLKWPKDAKDWSPTARLEFILYSLKLENALPVNLTRMIEFSAAIKSDTGLGFVAHYSRKPSSVGCDNACAVRLSRLGSTRGIPERLEMKSMLYLVKGIEKYVLVAVHGEGDKDVNENLVLKEFNRLYNSNQISASNSIKSIPNIDPIHLQNYLIAINSPKPKNGIEHGRKLSMNGAQELIGLFASAINPVSILKSVEYKLSYIKQNTNESFFDILMLWDEGIYNVDECYNNAGSPTWGVRFNPKEMFSHVQLNSEALVKRYLGENIIFNFDVISGTFLKSRKP
jgi:hypothetical protein